MASPPQRVVVFSLSELASFSPTYQSTSEYDQETLLIKSYNKPSSRACCCTKQRVRERNVATNPLTERDPLCPFFTFIWRRLKLTYRQAGLVALLRCAGAVRYSWSLLHSEGPLQRVIPPCRSSSCCCAFFTPATALLAYYIVAPLLVQIKVSSHFLLVCEFVVLGVRASLRTPTFGLIMVGLARSGDRSSCCMNNKTTSKKKFTI